MKNIFDYVGFRVLKWNRISRNTKSDASAIGYYTIIQGFVIFDILAVFLIENFTAIEKHNIYKGGKTPAVIFTILLYIGNIIYFRNKYSELESKWGNEEMRKKIFRGRVMVICFVTLFIFWIIYPIIRVNPLG